MMTFREKLEENRGKKLMIGGHRGHLSDIRENTIENYEQLKGADISHIELDVQLTKDGIPVIYHDLELSEKSPLCGRIRDYTAAKLKESFRIDTLDETIAWCKKHQMTVAFELKSRALDMYDFMPDTAVKLADAIAEWEFDGQCFAFSTDYRSLSALHKRVPNIPLGLIVPIIPADPVALMKENHADIYLCYIDNLCPEIIDTLHRAGFYADGSVINTKERLREALRIGVDLIESDYPEEMLKQYEILRDCSGRLSSE